MRPQINLIDPTLLPKVERFSSRTVALVTLVATTALGIHYSYERLQLSKTMALAKAQEGEHPEANTPDAPLADAALEARKRTITREEALRDGLAKLTDLPTDNSKMLSSVIAALPASLWLKEVDFVAKGGIRIVGGAVDPSALAEYSDSLSKVAAMHGLPVQVVTLEPQANEAQEQTSLPTYYHFVLATANAHGATP
jgi:Tfp pilus assembly protein PilN